MHQVNIVRIHELVHVERRGHRRVQHLFKLQRMAPGGAFDEFAVAHEGAASFGMEASQNRGPAAPRMAVEGDQVSRF